MNWAKELNQGKDAVYLIHGDERHIARSATGWLRASVLSDGVADFNLDRFDGRENVSVDAVVQACRTLPMMAARRFVWLRNAEAIIGRRADALKVLLEYISSPDDTTCLLIEANTVIKKNSAVYKRVSKYGCVFECKALRHRELGSWVNAQVRSQDRTMSASAVDYLVEALGNNMAGLSNAIGRLVLFVEEPHTIELSHARECVPYLRTHTVWELVDAVADRDVARSLEQAHLLMDQGKAPLQLLALVVRQFRQLMLGFDVRSSGGSLAAAASAAGVPSFRQNQFERQLKRYSGVELGRALRRLEKTDLALKGSKMPDELIFEELLISLCAPSAA